MVGRTPPLSERGCYFLLTPPPDEPREPEDPRDEEPPLRDDEPRDALRDEPLVRPEDDERTRVELRPVEELPKRTVAVLPDRGRE
jgi:hypothetical protein